MRPLQLVKETQVDQTKDEQINFHEDGTTLDGLYSVAAPSDDDDDDDDDDDEYDDDDNDDVDCEVHRRSWQAPFRVTLMPPHTWCGFLAIVLRRRKGPLPAACGC